MKAVTMLVFLAVAMPGLLRANDPLPPSEDSVQLDTMRLMSDRPLKSPLGAMLRSAVLPGWGQFYNERYWKAGLVTAVNAALVGRALYFNDRFETVRQPDGSRDRGYRERRDNYLWLFGLSYLLTLADAYVDAYLFGFETAMEVTTRPERGLEVGLALDIRRPPSLSHVK